MPVPNPGVSADARRSPSLKSRTVTALRRRIKVDPASGTRVEPMRLAGGKESARHPRPAQADPAPGAAHGEPGQPRQAGGGDKQRNDEVHPGRVAARDQGGDEQDRDEHRCIRRPSPSPVQIFPNGHSPATWDGNHRLQPRTIRDAGRGDCDRTQSLVGERRPRRTSAGTREVYWAA